MQKDSKKIIMNVICAFALFNLFTIFCGLILSITESINPVIQNCIEDYCSFEAYNDKVFVACSYFLSILILLPVFGLFVTKLFIRNKIINIIENVLVIILILICVGFLILGSIWFGNRSIVLAQKIDLTSLLAVSCLYEFYLAYDLINVFKEKKADAKKEIEE